MPFNPTTGVFTRVDNTFSQPVDGTIIEATDAEPTFNDWDDGLTQANGWAKPPAPITTTGTVTIADSDVFRSVEAATPADTTFQLPALADKVGPVTIWDADGVFDLHTYQALPAGSDPMMGLSAYPMSSKYAAYTFYPTARGWMVR